MKQLPILFSPVLVVELLADRKTQTRRLLRNDFGEIRHAGWPCSGRVWPGDPECREPRPGHHHVHLIRRSNSVHEHEASVRSPYGAAGDVLWVREAWAPIPMEHPDPGTLALARRAFHRADYLGEDVEHVGIPGWKPSIHMPRTACRLWLEVEEVSIEPLQAIQWHAIRAEGVDCPEHDFSAGFCTGECPALRLAWAELWDSINRKRAPWSSNPWVWVVRFKRVEEPS